MVVNSGENEGFSAWGKLIEYYEPNARSRVAGQLLNLLNFSLSGDVEERLGIFERDLNRYEGRSGERISDSMRICIVMRQLHDGPLRQHQLLNAARLTERPVLSPRDHGHPPRPEIHRPSSHGG